MHAQASRTQLVATVAVLALGLTAGSAPVRAASGGPDGFGYTWHDTGEPGVFFGWIDITATGTDITVRMDDDNVGFQPLSFPMPYYGSVYTQLAVCTNGWLSLVDDTSQSFTNVPLPDAADPVGLVAAFWDDLTLTTAGNIYFQDFGNRAVVSWIDVPVLSDTMPNSFQVILRDDGRITVQYLSLQGRLDSCTLGIESPDQMYGLTVYNDDPAGVPPNAFAVEFRPPVPVPMNLDCTGAAPLNCGDVINGDLSVGTPNQDAYLCSMGDYSGNEQVYLLDLTAPSSFRLVLETISGNPDMILVDACNPNTCVRPPADFLDFTNAMGTWHLVIDAAPGDEGAYQLRRDCFPLSIDVDCATPTPINCGDTVTGDLSLGVANQDRYECTNDAYDGREQVYLIDLPSPVTLQVNLTAMAGNPDLIVVNPCDPNQCAAPVGDSVLINDAMGQYYIIVDAAAGDEGPYELSIDCLADEFQFCGGPALELERWGNDGSWLVEGWFYHPSDTHVHALRVDGGPTTYTHDNSCTQFPTVATGAQPPFGPAFVNWGAPEGSVDVRLSETSSGGCCGLLVEIEVTNTDTVPHFYDYRQYIDTAFGTAPGGGGCGAGTVDGGPAQVNGMQLTTEAELLPLGADTCEGQLQMFSADDPTLLMSSYQMLPPNLPSDMELVAWNDGGDPCTTWADFADGENTAGCNPGNGDNSLLLIWRFPAGAGMLAPGESATASYRVGWQCPFPCNGCEDPILTTGTAVDFATCNFGVQLDWLAATFPGGGNGVYHVYRSTVDFTDALANAPITPPGGITTNDYLDTTTTSGVQYYYVVQAESTDYPNCGTGPTVMGSTDELQLGPVMDEQDSLRPSDVGNTLRATGHTDSTVDFEWTLAPLPDPDESYAVWRSDDMPDVGFTTIANPVSQTWTDPNAPPRFMPSHVWFYDIRIVDRCGNASDD